MPSIIDKKAVVRQVFNMVEPMVTKALEAHTFHPEREGVYIIALDATRPYDPTALDSAMLKGMSIHRGRWPEGVDYEDIARRKAFVSWRTHLSSGEVVTQHPELLEEGDAKYQGAVYSHGIIVAVSGVKSWWDEGIAMMIASLIHAGIQEQMNAIAADDNVNYIGG